MLRSTIQVDGCWDIETENWSTFVVGALYIPGQKTRVYSWRHEDKFVDDLISLKGTYWAHNGGRYDFLWLLKHLLARGVKWRVSLSGSSVGGLFVEEATFRDSARLVPMSLENGARIGNVPKSSTSLPCNCERECGGYCSIRRDMSRPMMNRLIEYLINDCKATYSMLDSLSTLAERWDLDLKSTIGASAWATVKRQGVSVAEWGGRKSTFVTKDYTDARKAYFGGRTQVFRPVAESGYAYDINSAYPAALATLQLPTGSRRRLGGDEAGRAFENGKPGLYRANVYVSECYLPPLPVRGRARIGFPTGAFNGWWTAVELQASLLHGATIGRVTEAMVWDSSEMVLAPFCRHVWGLRDQAGPKTSLGTWLKLYANSLTGKLATKPTVERVYSNPDAIVVCPADFPCEGILCGHGGCCPHRACTGKCGRVTPIADDIPIFVKQYAQLSECSHVEWAAYLTSFTRTKILEFAQGGDDGVYCDTDSWKCLSPRDGALVGPKLGQWKDEGCFQAWESPAPKTYCYADEDGVAHGASKGIPDSVRNFHLLRTGVTVDRGVNTFKVSAKRGEFFARKSLTRVINPDGKTFGDRKLGDDGRTYPVTVKQLSDDFWEFQ